MSKVRFNIMVYGSMGGTRREPFAFNRQPLRPGSVGRAMLDAVDAQYEHMAYNGRYTVSGLALVGGSVWLWNTSNRRACVIRPERV